VEPYRGFKRAGARGLVVGAGSGLVGVVVKPTVGVLDATAHTADGVRRVVRKLAKKHEAPLTHRARLPQVFGNDGRLLHHTISLSAAAWISRRLPPGSSTSIPAVVIDHFVGKFLPVSWMLHCLLVVSSLIHIVPSPFLYSLGDIGLRREAEQKAAKASEQPILSVRLRTRPGTNTFLVVTSRRVMQVHSPISSVWELTKDWEVPLYPVSNTRDLRASQNPVILWNDEGERCSIAIISTSDSVSSKKSKFRVPLPQLPYPTSITSKGSFPKNSSKENDEEVKKRTFCTYTCIDVKASSFPFE